MIQEKSLDRWLRLAVRQQGGTCIRLHGTNGVPDQLALLPNGRAIFIELKTPVGVLSPMQKHWLDRLTQLGFEACSVHSKSDLRSILGVEL